MGSAIADLIEVEVDDGVDELAHGDLAIAACKHAEGRNNRDTLVGFHKGDLCFEQLYNLSASIRCILWMLFAHAAILVVPG